MPRLMPDPARDVAPEISRRALNGSAAASPPATASAVSVGEDEVAPCDWDALLSAVKARLRSVVAESHVVDTLPSDGIHADHIRTSVLECAAALDQLHETLVHEVVLRHRLEMTVFDTQTALAQSRAELAGTRAGEMRARQLALHDDLTLLPNRSFFCQRLDEALSRSERQQRAIAVLYLDLDNFKAINDTYGHAAGDELLRIIAARLNRAIRNADIISRLGGDEFALLLSDVADHEQLGRVAEKLAALVASPVKIGELHLSVYASIGIAVCPVDGMTAEALLDSADAAMYHAKRHQTGFAFTAETRSLNADA